MTISSNGMQLSIMILKGVDMLYEVSNETDFQ